MLIGLPPFIGNSIEGIENAILENELKFPDDKLISEEWKSVIRFFKKEITCQKCE